MTTLSGARVLVTGGAGFIGSHLVDTLLGRDAAEVRALDNLKNGTPHNVATALEDPRFSLIAGDIRDSAVRERALRGIDMVFHLACLGVRHSLHDPLENHEVNALGSLLMLESARSAGVRRFVYVSTSEVFGTAQYAPMDERHPTWPETVYGGSKLAGEAYARAYFRTYGMDTVVIRPFNTYGPRSHFEGDSGEVIPRTIVRLISGERPIIFGDGEQTRDFMHVLDTSAALALLADAPGLAGETLNLGSGTEVTVNALCAAVAAAVGRPDLTPVHDVARPGDVRRLLGDPTHMASLTGFAPTVEFTAGVADLVEWFQKSAGADPNRLSHMEDRNWVTAEAVR
ncbi:GDP-mannose 4,6-dehydratase [Cryobacterium sp. PH31-AA6]|uniref:NAD-dependent epimerase/dehydratase family protein n=1 Tax=Cryobacterium sp. PH31-AA6 TaxID=3046205 RepID=UPI0024B8B0D8|nr:GDP-mannose 4,6-dehydratase [Cryobacterium sp. PH31-AA6]MDJ0323725.1 GDP-mannose 4,6-dehydratase [Cryobacterium sp. PH31-AA6]